jgi:hypothetical protein
MIEIFPPRNVMPPALSEFLSIREDDTFQILYFKEWFRKYSDIRGTKK